MTFTDKRYRLVAAAAVMAAVAATSPFAVPARDITVTGHVRALKNNEPLPAVTIYDNASDRLLGSTNDEGYYSITVDDGATLTFSILGSEDKVVGVDGRQLIDITLDPTSVVLAEVVVQGSRVTDIVMAEPTDIDVRGNYLQVKTRVKVPHERFHPSDRLVIQPTIRNVTRGNTIFMRPLVFDGYRYAATQERMYDWDRSLDPLTPYVSVKQTGGRTDDIITVADSVFVENPKDDFRCDLFMAIEDYNRVVYRDTTTIARGTVNPLRFLNYDLGGVFVDQEEFLPKPELQLRDTHGDINLTFRVGKQNLDMGLGDNRREMDSLLRMLREIEANPSMGLKSFTIHGTASPEGNAARNNQLANGRVNSAMNVIVGQLAETTRRSADIKATASVSTWSDLAALMRSDGLDSEAAEVDKAVARYRKSPAAQERAVRSLPFFRNLIDKVYLPRMRRVEYEIVTSKYRFLTDDEIRELYRTSPSTMSRYEYWRLYSLENRPEEKQRIIEQALEVHPGFLVAASDLAALRIDAGTPDAELLPPYMEKTNELPDATVSNQAVAELDAGHFSVADNLASSLPDTPRYHKLKIYSRAASGHFEEVMQEISADSPFNEVLLLLAVKANDKAWQKAQKLGDSAREEYIKAVAANRVDEYMAATTHLEKAFDLDPSLEEIARVDGDVIDLLQP
ncbi:MAG: carboxypeptidase-like regulatory domain-containing protein [Clostridium sp.]|nr:carboxypeptidase-like regulatory domain-containing protein [Clostridium sp.]